MDMVRKITDELSIAGQLTLDQLQQLAEDGYGSVVNLRSPNKVGFLNDEQQQVEDLGLCYASISTPIKSLSLDDVLSAIQQLSGLPKPMLPLFCHFPGILNKGINRKEPEREEGQWM